MTSANGPANSRISRSSRSPAESLRGGGVVAASDVVSKLRGSSNMGVFSKSVHEMFHAFHHCGTRFAAIAQITDQTGVVRGKAAKLGDGHPRRLDEFFDFADEHWLFDPP
jgi:hypothetical protein